MGSNPKNGIWHASAEELHDTFTLSQSPEGRLWIVQNQLLPNLVHLFGNLCDEEIEGVPTGDEPNRLLYLLRIFRNVCVHSLKTSEFLTHCNVHERAAKIVTKSGDSLLTKIATQLLANLSAGGREQATVIWKVCWPDCLTYLAKIQPGETYGPLCMILFHCYNASEVISKDIYGAGGSWILKSLLSAPLQHQEIADAHLEMLLTLLCFQRGHIFDLQNLSEDQAKEPKMNLQSWHIGLLSALSTALQESPAFLLQRAETFNLKSLAANILSLACLLARLPKIRQHKDLEAALHPITLQALLSKFPPLKLQLNCRLHMKSVLVQFLRDLSSRDDRGGAFANGQAITDLLIAQHSLINKLLSMLTALGPVQPRRPDKKKPIQEWPVSDRLHPSLYAEQQPYEGYRTDLVTVLGNVCYRNKQVQEEMQELGGIELILANCQVDDKSPLLREAGLWGIRNLCEGNSTIQQQIEQLQIVETCNTPELQKAGLDLNYNSGTGKMELCKSQA